jgi:hypothetical protein
MGSLKEMEFAIEAVIRAMSGKDASTVRIEELQRRADFVMFARLIAVSYTSMASHACQIGVVHTRIARLGGTQNSTGDILALSGRLWAMIVAVATALAEHRLLPHLGIHERERVRRTARAIEEAERARDEAVLSELGFETVKTTLLL